MSIVVYNLWPLYYSKSKVKRAGGKKYHLSVTWQRQGASEIQTPVWKNKQKTIKLRLVVDWLQKIKPTKTVFNMILSLQPYDLLCIIFRSNRKYLSASRLNIFLFLVGNLLFLSTLCPICLPKKPLRLS